MFFIPSCRITFLDIFIFNFQVSTMKCGLLPLCQEAMVIGEVGYADYTGDPNNTSSIFSAFAAAKVRQ
jgi:hypothetical protein